MNIYRDDVAFDLYIQAALEEECEEADGSIPPAVTLYWQEQEIKRLRAALQWAVQELRRCDNADYAAHIADTLDVHLSQEKR